MLSHPGAHASAMKFSRRLWLKILATFGFGPVPQAGGETAGPRPSLPGACSTPPIDWPDPRLRAWLRQPRLPVLDSSHPQVRLFVWAMLERKPVEFIYLGGSTPGQKRTVSPGLVFKLDELGPVYVAGFCHARGEERVFRIDRVLPVASLN